MWKNEKLSESSRSSYTLKGLMPQICVSTNKKTIENTLTQISLKSTVFEAEGNTSIRLKYQEEKIILQYTIWIVIRLNPEEKPLHSNNYSGVIFTSKPGLTFNSQGKWRANRILG